jgi:hypothetical protein
MALPRLKCPKGNDTFQKDYIRADKGFIIGCGRSRTIDNLLCTYQNSRSFNVISDSANITGIVTTRATLSYLGDMCTVMLQFTPTFSGDTASFNLNTDELVPVVPTSPSPVTGPYIGIGNANAGCGTNIPLKVELTRSTPTADTVMTVTTLDEAATLLNGTSPVITLQVTYGVSTLCQINN